MKKTIKSTNPITHEATLYNIYDEEAHIFHSNDGYYIRMNNRKTSVPSYNRAVNILYGLGYRF